MTTKTVNCHICGKSFTTICNTAKYCSDECRKTAMVEQKRKAIRTIIFGERRAKKKPYTPPRKKPIPMSRIVEIMRDRNIQYVAAVQIAEEERDGTVL